MGVNKKDNRIVSQVEIFKLPYLVLIVSILFTIGATYIFYKNEQSKNLDRFQVSVDRYKNRIDTKLRSYVGLLKAGRGFVESSDQLNKKTFSGFFNSLDVEKNYPEIIKIGFSKKTSSTESANLVKQMQTEGDADFKVFPLLTNADSQPIIYLEPENKADSSEIGFDLLSDPVYRAVIDRAKETGTAAATGKVMLGQQNKKNIPGFLIFMPVYKGGNTPATVEERNNLLEGFIYDVVNAEEFLENAQKNAGEPDIAAAIYENEIKPENLVVKIGGDYQNNSKHLTANGESGIADKKWIISYRELPSFENQSGINWTPFIFIIGTVFSLMFFGTTYLETYARGKAEKIASELRESEREKGFLLEREQKARRAVEESGRIKDEFISVVSHELRTPLNSIAGWSRILRACETSESIKLKALESIEKNVRVQTEIVEDLLEFSQILSDTPEFLKQEVNISGIFEEVFAEFEETAKSKQIALEKKNLLNGERLIGDSEQLKKVFKNLFSNAIKFTPEGGKICASLNKTESNVEIKIADTGQGIAPADVSGIFESFKQADSSITRIHGGLGLGLAIVRRIVELHGGLISAFSKGIGKGTEFTIVLPVVNS